MRVVRTEWSDETMTDAEVSDPSGSVIEILRRVRLTAQAGPSHMQAKKKGILTPETAHNGRQCLEYPHLDTDSHPPVAATGCRPSDATTLGGEAGSGQSKTKATKTLAVSAAACERKKLAINCTTKKAGVTPASGMSEYPGAVYTAAQYLEAEEQRTE